MWADPDRLNQLLDWHLALRPGMQVQDVYKLLYQGVLGPEHLLTSPQEFEQRLREEFKAVEANDSERLVESIHPTRLLARLNLRPYKAHAYDLSLLVQACLETAHHKWGSPAELRQAWDYFISTCVVGRWQCLPPSEATSFSSWVAEQGYPPVHHSESYSLLYRPAYRLVLPEWLQSEESNPASGFPTG